MVACESKNALATEHVVRWLTNFEVALSSGDYDSLQQLFAEQSHWRDMLAFTWNVTPHEDRQSIIDDLLKHQLLVNARHFKVAENRTPPRCAKRLGREVYEAIFSFETDAGRCSGVLRLPTDNPDQAWVFSTALDELKGHEEPINDRRPGGSAYSRNFGGANWSDLRERDQAYENREPTVLIVGGSQFGITLAARLRLLNIDTLVVEALPRIGDTWRNRYHSLALHNQVGKNHFPYIEFPPSWPKYLSKDMLANFIEFYAGAMECNVWTDTRFIDGRYDDAREFWSARIRRADGSERVLHPRHLVFANGVVGDKKKPQAPGLEDFKGEVLHTADYYSGSAYRGKRALVMGTGTSGHDCAQDLHGHGADVTMIQRGSSTVVSIEAACFNDTLYLEDKLPLDDADLLGVTPTFSLLERGYQLNVKRMKEHDKSLLEGLAAKGFKLDFEPNEAGHQMKLRARFGGYYLNCGCSDLIVNGDVKLIQWEDAERFVADGLLMKDGRVETADLVITATGYYTQEEMLGRVLGDEIAQKVGAIWGLNDQGELRNMFVPTPQKGLWFLGGGLSQNRVYSKYVALQIKARELDLVH